jgi:hypothetical protein
VSNHANATARKANLATERLVCRLTLQLEGEVLDRLFVETVKLDDALATANAHDTPELTGYRRRVARHIATAITNKSEAIALVQRGRGR